MFGELKVVMDIEASSIIWHRHHSLGMKKIKNKSCHKIATMDEWCLNKPMLIAKREMVASRAINNNKKL